MAGRVTVNVLQLGDSSTATQNFALSTAVDGTAKLARGNYGATTQDILTVNAAGALTAGVGLNGTVGATTPSTGAFTTLSATGQAKFNGVSGTPVAAVGAVAQGGIQFPNSGGGGLVILPLSGGGGEFYTYTGAVGSETYSLKAAVTSTGLSVTGALSATGTITKINTAATASQFLNVTGSTTAQTYANFTNTGGSYAFGVEASTGATIFTGSSAYAAVLGTTNSTSLQFATNNAVGVTLDASGNLLVGQSAISQTTVGFSVQGSSGTIPGTVSTALTASTSAVNTYHVYSTGAAAYRFYVGLDGVIHATNTSITAISDVSLKENIRDLETGLTEVMALKPRRFDWKNGDASNVAGFIAQELETVLPDLVTESLYSEGVTKKSIQMGNILPTLVKAIQELKAEFDAYKAAHP